MARTRIARHPKIEQPEPEDISQDTPDEDFPQEPANDNQPPAISKAEAVRQALARGLNDVGDIEDYLKREHGLTIPRPQISAYASQARAKARREESGEAAPSRRRSSSHPVQQASIPATFASDVREIRQLVDKLGGADECKEVIGQLAGLVGRYGSSGLSELIDAIS